MIIITGRRPDRIKELIFELRQKDEFKVWPQWSQIFLMSARRLFQRKGARKEKALQPADSFLTLGIDKSPALIEHGMEYEV